MGCEPNLQNLGPRVQGSSEFHEAQALQSGISSYISWLQSCQGREIGLKALCRVPSYFLGVSMQGIRVWGVGMEGRSVLSC